MFSKFSVSRAGFSIFACLAMLVTPITGVHATTDDTPDVGPSYSDELPPDVQIIEGEQFDRVEVISPDGLSATSNDSYSTASNGSVSDGGSGLSTTTNGGGVCTAPLGKQVTCKDSTGYLVVHGPLSTMKQVYSWSVPWYSSSNANVIGRGFLNGKATWRGGGNAKSGKFSVPWYGENGVSIIATKQVKVRSMNPPAGVVVIWK